MRVLLWMRIFLLVMIMAKFVFPHGYLIIITLFYHFSVSIRTLLYYNPKQTQLKLWTNLTFIKKYVLPTQSTVFKTVQNK